MTKRTKQGFSLIEIMILFTVLSVMLAASMPFISKKSNPVPKKINHGVYRCINTNGGLLEELYTGSRQVESHTLPSGKTCSFKVPSAAIFKVDMYSAGSGGTISARITSALDDFRNVKYTMAGTQEGAKIIDANGNTVVDSNRSTDPISEPTEAELEANFKGKTVIRYTYTGDAGRGGYGALTYMSPLSSFCEAHTANLTEKETVLEDAKAAQKQAKDDYDAAIADLNGKINDAEDKYSDANSDSSNLTEALNIIGYMDNILRDAGITSGYSPSYTALKNDATNPNYNQSAGQGSSMTIEAYFNAIENGTNLVKGVITYAAEAKADTIYSGAKKEADYNKDTNIKNYFPEPYKSNNCETQQDIVNYLKANDSLITNQERQAALDDNMTVYKDFLNGMGDIASELKSDAYGTFQDLAQKYETELNPPVLTDKINAKKSEYYTKLHQKSDGVTADGGLYGLKQVVEDVYTKETEPTLAADVQTAGENVKKAEEGSLDKILKERGLYASQSNAYDLSGNVEKQLTAYCKAAYHDYYAAHPDIPILSNTFAHSDYQNSMSQIFSQGWGGLGGKGSYLRISFPINYKGNDQNGNSYKKYLENLVTTGNAEGYYLVRCSNKNCTGVNGVEIDSSSPSAAEGVPVKADYENTNDRTNLMHYPPSSSTRHYLNTTDGQDLKDVDKPYVAWAVPMYNGNLPSGHEYVTLAKTLATGGKAKKLDMNESPAKSGTFVDTNKYYSVNGGGGYNSPVDAADAILGTADNLKDYGYKVEHDKSEVDGSNIPLNEQRGKATEFDNIYKNIQITDAGGKPLNVRIDVFSSDDEAANSAKKLLTSKNNPIEQNPKLNIRSEMWSKSYTIGGPGRPGKFMSTVETNLGSICNFTVPGPGKPYNLAYPEYEDMDIMEGFLKTNMVCENKDGEVVFDRTLDGGAYNLEPVISNKKFYWKKNGPTALSLPVPAYSDQPVWKPTSMWAKVYNQYMMVSQQGQSVYDLNAKNVGKAGTGTSFVDKCLEPKGKYETQMLYDIRYFKEYESEYDEAINQFAVIGEDGSQNQTAVTHAKYTALSPVETVELGKPVSPRPPYTGYKDHFNCYGISLDSSAQEYSFDVTTEDEIVKAGHMSLSAGEGGGGAVVITW